MSLPSLHSLALRHKDAGFPLVLGGDTFSDTLGNRAFLALWMVVRGRNCPHVRWTGYGPQDPLSICLEDNHHPRQNAREAISHLRKFYYR